MAILLSIQNVPRACIIERRSEKMGIFALAWIRPNVHVFVWDESACWYWYDACRLLNAIVAPVVCTCCIKRQTTITHTHTHLGHSDFLASKNNGISLQLMLTGSGAGYAPAVLADYLHFRAIHTAHFREAREKKTENGKALFVLFFSQFLTTSFCHYIESNSEQNSSKLCWYASERRIVFILFSTFEAYSGCERNL